MGFFSKTCAKTNLPIITVHREGSFEELTSIVVLYPDGKKLEGIYDGYGRVIDGDDVIPIMEDCGSDEWDDVKFVLSKHYAGETYEQLGKSGRELGQGFFMNDDFLEFCVEKGKFKSYAEYKRKFNEIAGW
jgi:hypothetical protein